ncbi:hypothetical protein ACXZ1K_04610 [Pedobacter sp. PWIIR3]
MTRPLADEELILSLKRDVMLISNPNLVHPFFGKMTEEQIGYYCINAPIITFGSLTDDATAKSRQFLLTEHRRIVEWP